MKHRKKPALKIGVFFNPFAGNVNQFKDIAGSIEVLIAKVGGLLVTAAGDYGAEYLKHVSHTIVTGTEKYPDDLRRIVSGFCEWGTDIIIGIGGDGTLGYIAGILIEAGSRVPLMGVASGTANVGPLLRFNQSKLQQIDLQNLKFDPVGAIKVGRNGTAVGYAFIDTVIGKTFLGTRHGKSVNLDAKVFLNHGLKKTRPVCGLDKPSGIKVAKNDSLLFNCDEEISQIIVSPLHHSGFYVGKAITGLLCWAYPCNLAGAIMFSSCVIVDAEAELPSKAMKQVQALFSREDTITIEGVSGNDYLIIDGNPTCPADGVLEFQFLPDAVLTVRDSENSILPIVVQ
ncbi:MAG: diacylglycerol kinase family protein [Spirochaetota bacterium]